jgi:mono/diheme cytochrome c family protein
MRKGVAWAVLAVVAATGSAVLLLRPAMPDPAAYAGLAGDPLAGEGVFWAAGCANCHMSPGAAGEARLVLAGGQEFPTDFGTFRAPNISPHPEAGIGGWSVADLGHALRAGVSPDGAHYYPAFPYWSYAGMRPQEVADLHAYLMTLPQDATANLPHDLTFPFGVRAVVGGWKLLAPSPPPLPEGALTEAEARGQHLVEVLGHCAECHTPRDALGRLDVTRWMAGAPSPDGRGRVPGITPATLGWSEGEIVEYLTSGFTPDYDSAGGHMAHVVESLAMLPETDRAAIAAYLKRLPAVE